MSDWLRENYKKIIKIGQLIFVIFAMLGIIYAIITHQYYMIFDAIAGAVIGIFGWKFVIILVLKSNKIL